MVEKRSVRDDRPYDQRKRHRPNGAPKPIVHQNRPDQARTLTGFSTDDLQAGLLSLLDQFVDTTAGVDGYEEELHHARKLHSLLQRRATQSLPSQAKQALDRTRPDQSHKPVIPAYNINPIKLDSGIPPLPPINEPHLKTLVFQHRSVATDHTPEGEPVSYERLEFLGDAYIEVISSRIIYARFPDMEVGPQSQLRETMVRNERLAQFANAYHFGDRIIHLGQEHQNNGWTKILADVFEAYVAAAVLSDPINGFSTVETWLTELWAPQLLEVKVKPLENRDSKNELTRLIGTKGIKVDYRMDRPMEMINGVQKYYIGCYLTGWGYKNEWLGSGQGQTKSKAGMAAATDALERNSAVMQDAKRKKAAAFPNMMKKPESKEGSAVTAGKKTVVEIEKQENKKETVAEVTGASS
jgi:ribonuclease-3